MFASTSTSTSALPTLRQALCQLSSPSSLPTSQLSVHWDLNLGPAQPGSFPAQSAPLLGASQLSVHRWTSTWDLPSSVCTAGPHPGTFPAQCAPLDLNLGPSELSVHRWTSTWDLPSSVPEDMPDKMPKDMPDRVPEDMPDRMLEDMPGRMPDRMPDKMSDRMPEDLPDKVPAC